MLLLFNKIIGGNVAIILKGGYNNIEKTSVFIDP